MNNALQWVYSLVKELAIRGWNRARSAIEVAKAVAEEIGASRTAKLKLAYLHVLHGGDSRGYTDYPTMK